MKAQEAKNQEKKEAQCTLKSAELNELQSLLSQFPISHLAIVEKIGVLINSNIKE